MAERPGAQLIPASDGRFDLRFRNFFAAYSRRLIRRSFHAVRMTPDSMAVAQQANTHGGPLIVALNHGSWWDPLVALVLSRDLLPDRIGIAPMDSEQLQKFRFMRRLGIFGIDPDSQASLLAMGEYVGSYFRRHPPPLRPSLMITPQGQFTDPRSPIRIRPGISSIAANAENVLVCSLAIEYTHWQAKLPEIFVRLCAVMPPSPEFVRSTASWHRTISDTMQGNADWLARSVCSRDELAFCTLLAGRGAAINPAYDALLGARGRDAEIGPARKRVAREGSTLRPLPTPPSHSQRGA